MPKKYNKTLNCERTKKEKLQKKAQKIMVFFYLNVNSLNQQNNTFKKLYLPHKINLSGQQI